MYTHILVPLDGSDVAERAVPVAARIARSAKARVTLVQAIAYTTPVPVAFDPAPFTSSSPDGLALAEEYLARIAQTPDLRDLTVEHKVMVGPAAATILETAQELHADLVVLCSHGRTGASRWVLGSVAERVARHATVPVLVLRQQGPALVAADATPQTVRALVALDGSPFAEELLTPTAQLVASLAAPGEGKLHLLTILPPTGTDPTNVADPLALKGARDYLQGIADRVRESFPTLELTWSVTANYDVAHSLLHEAGAGKRVAGTTPIQPDLIAIATHGRTGVARWALGSVTERVLHGTALPLLIVRPSAVATHERERAHATAPADADTRWSALF